jgi:DNA polymerase III epsilon subunit-like protein
MKLPQFVGRAHNALDDARYCRLLWEHLTLRRAA